MKLFPVHPGDAIKSLCPRAVPWGMLAKFEHRAELNHRQSLTVLAERGGLDIGEMYSLLQDKDLDFKGLVPFNIALAGVLSAVSEYLKQINSGEKDNV